MTALMCPLQSEYISCSIKPKELPDASQLDKEDESSGDGEMKGRMSLVQALLAAATGPHSRKMLANETRRGPVF